MEEAAPASGPARGNVIDVTPGQAGRLPEIVAGAPAGATIRLANGRYPLSGDAFEDRLIFRRPGVTLRSRSGRPGRVVIDGAYGPGALIHPFADRITIAELTLKRAQDHLVHAYPPSAGREPARACASTASGSSTAASSS